MVEFILIKVFQFNRTDESDFKSTKLESRIFRIDIGSTLFITLDTLSPNRLVFLQNNLPKEEKTFSRFDVICDENVI